MKTFRDYLSESEETFDTPVAGDAFDIELAPDHLIETVVLSVDGDAIVIEGDDTVLSLLESRGMLNESIQRYGAVGNSPGMGHTLSECGTCDMNEGCGCDSETAADPGEYGEEGDMAKNELLTIVRAARRLTGMLDNDDDMPEWTQKKITKAADYVDTAADYISSQKERGIMEQQLDEGVMDKIKGIVPRFMQMVGADTAADIANRVKQVTGGDYSLTRDNAVKVAKAFGFDRMVNKPVRENDGADQYGLAGNWQGKLLQLIHAGTIGGGIAHVAMGGGTIGGGLGAAGVAMAIVGGILLLFTETFWSKNRGMVGAMGRYGNQGSEVSKGPESKLDEEQSEDSPVARAVLHRIMMAHPSLLAQHGPERVMAAVDELADRVNIGPDDEIGSSDVSGWVRDVIRMLAELPDEPMNVVDALEEAEIDDTWMNDRHREFYKRNPHFKRNDRERVEVGRGTQLATRVKPAVKPAQVQKKPATRFGIAEDLQADSGERYRSADDFFSQFEADWFDEEQVSDEGMEIRGYIDGVNVMAWRYDSPRKTTGYGVYDDSQLTEATAASNDPLLAKAVDLAPVGAIGEAEYQGRDVPLGKPMRGDVKKFKVYVRDPKTGNVKKVNFGHGGTSAKRAGQKTMKIKKSDPARRRSFRARHNCDNPGPRTKARYWSCRAW